VVAAALYWWRATRQRSWRVVVVVALIGGLLGTVALGALALTRTRCCWQAVARSWP
jgi:RsiW-degrading membrane proteinase PrsW (M82 family)